MNRIFQTSAVLLVLAMAFCSQALTAPVPPGELVECAVRTGLPNFIAKCERGDTVKVAYFGGSITAQAGWRIYSLDLLRTAFPQAKFVEIYAPLGGTGSSLGVYRLEHDVLNAKPDLLLVEFSVNDASTDGGVIRASLDGIVRNTWSALPDCDICFVYVANEMNIQYLKEGKLAPAAQIHEEIAAYYGIPSINFGVEVARLDKDGKIAMKAPKATVSQLAGKELDKVSGIQINPDGKIPFTADGVHPYLDTGHKIYAGAFARALPMLRKASGKASAHVQLPTPLVKEYVKSVSFLSVDSAILSGAWTHVENPGKVFGSEDFNKFAPSFWRGDPGAKLSFKFKGRSLMLYTACGPASGMFELIIDGKAEKLNSFDPYSAYWRLSPQTVTKNLDPEKEHTVELKVLSDSFDKHAIMDKVGRGGRFDASNKAYTETCLVIGGICIEAGQIVK